LLRKKGGYEAEEEGNQDLNLNPHLLSKVTMTMNATFARSWETERRTVETIKHGWRKKRKKKPSNRNKHTIKPV